MLHHKKSLRSYTHNTGVPILVVMNNNHSHLTFRLESYTKVRISVLHAALVHVEGMASRAALRQGLYALRQGRVGAQE